MDCKVTCAPEIKKYKTISYRNCKSINIENFNNDVSESLDISTGTFGDRINNYTEVMTNTLNKHAPLKTKRIKLVPDAPWFDGEYAELRRQRRRAEKLYRRTGLLTDRKKYVDLRKQTTTLAYCKKRRFYDEKLDTSNNKVLFSVVNKLLDDKQDAVLPTATSDKDLADSFMNYFVNKIAKLRSQFTKPAETNPLAFNTDTNVKCLSVFDYTTTDEVLQIIMSYGIKCSSEDPLTVELMKSNLDYLIPIWVQLINISLEEGSLECLKSAVILPLIKELDAFVDTDILKNYRPVSNLLFLEKLIERIVAIRLDKHMTENDLHIQCQYGYKRNHSTEALLVKVVNELLLACDDLIPTILMLLDLSAAFDTVDQKKMLAILKYEIGITGKALKWFESFLCGRSQRVKVGDSYSFIAELFFGVTQGSVLGPPLFNVYIRSLYPYIQPMKFDIYGFADDHQLLKTFMPILQIQALEGDINKCFIMLSKWMEDHFLCLNNSKTKILVVAPPSVKAKIHLHGTYINNSCVRFVENAKNLGVILDDELTFENQITAVVKSCFGTIRNLSKIKSFLNYKHLKVLVSACVFSKIDYANSLYYGISSALLRKLQAVQNSAVKLIRSKGNSGMSIEAHLRNFHWLPVKDRITFKILLTVHKCLIGKAPDSLSEFMNYNTSDRTRKLEQYRSKRMYGERAFSRVGSKMWNLLPMDIRVEMDTEKFKVLLKTFLFKYSRTFHEKLNEK